MIHIFLHYLFLFIFFSILHAYIITLFVFVMEHLLIHIHKICLRHRIFIMFFLIFIIFYDFFYFFGGEVGEQLVQIDFCGHLGYA